MKDPCVAPTTDPGSDGDPRRITSPRLTNRFLIAARVPFPGGSASFRHILVPAVRAITSPLGWRRGWTLDRGLLDLLFGMAV